MSIELLFFAIILLVLFAVFDLMVGVSNDAVNFLNSSIGSRVAPRYIIMMVASMGIILGVTFSGGMMEVARKGIFHPQFFNLPDLINIFLAVMITDVILLDIFNTFGLPTSTTVSIVFELLGGAVAVSVLKLVSAGAELSLLTDYINTASAMVIIFGILLSIVVAFICGTVIQFLSRLLFTFDYLKRLARYGAIWGGIALASITYFILVKGAKGASFIPLETAEWIKLNAGLMMAVIFGASALLLQILLFLKVNIFRPIVLIGTFALAMAFAANDLVNFIGVPMAGYHAYNAAAASGSPLTASMAALADKVPTDTYLLLIAGLIMVLTLWISKKARSVTETEVKLCQQDEGQERFQSSFLSRFIVRSFRGFFSGFNKIIPAPLLSWAGRRLDTHSCQSKPEGDNQPSFDLLRASVNLMVASALISYATSYKLPLSTTYVTFMVAMGTSFADQAWGRESAVYRITGVLTVIGGWFMTALMAFAISALFAVIIFYGQTYGLILLMLLVVLVIWKNHRHHKARARSRDMDAVFNLKKVNDIPETISCTLEHLSILICEMRESLDEALEGLFEQDEHRIKSEKKKIGKIQRWADIITANIFKSMRLLQKADVGISYKYGQTIRRLQKLADGYRDIITRSYHHVSNHHEGLLDKQVSELRQAKSLFMSIMSDVETNFNRKGVDAYDEITRKNLELKSIAQRFNQAQMERIRNGESKTRLNILFYALMGNMMMLSKQNLKLLEIFGESVSQAEKTLGFDLD
jgi:phosphate/sulfate permease